MGELLMRLRSLSLTLLLALGLAACAPGPAGQDVRDVASGGGREPGRTLVAGVRVEPSTIADRQLRSGGVALYLSGRLFNAGLALLDDAGLPRAYLAEELPRLNTDTWRVLPDGRMETTYRLRPNLAWHDGSVLSAEDFVFAHRVYSHPELAAGTPPFNAVEEVIAPDARTVLVRWHRPYPDAGSLTARSREFPPLPRHVLEASFQEDSPDAFSNHLYWSREYVGLGPYRLERWEPGSFIEAAAFGGHILGRAKIERIKIIFISDANTALANLLSGEIHLSADTSLRLEQGAIVKREWGPRNAGTVLQHPNQWRTAMFQQRPEMVAPRALLDARVRKALAHAIDKQAINEALYSGEGILSDFIISPKSEFGPAAEPAVVRYPLDARRTEQLMTEAGFTRGADGTFASLADGRFAAEVKTNAAADNEAEIAILASGWRQAGFEFQEAVLPAVLAQDGQARSTFPGVYTFNTGVGESTLIDQTTARIPRAENRWVGGNRGGWSNAEFDRLVEAFTTTLDRDERARQAARMAAIYTEDLPSISLFFRTQPWAFVSALRGLAIVAPESNMAWNVHEWEFK